MIIDEEWFDDIILTDGATFTMPLIKCAKTRVNQKIKFPCNTKRCIQAILINKYCNTSIVQILREISYGDFIFKGNFLIRLPKYVELSYEWIKKIFKYQKPEFYSRLFGESENGPFEVPTGRSKTYDKKVRT